MKIYPYRTTTEKMEQHRVSIEESGDIVLSVHHVAGRDWTLICRKGADEPTVAELSASELGDVIAAAVTKAMDTLDVTELPRARGGRGDRGGRTA